MQPYSHFAIAAQLEAEIRPDTPADYYWGAVAADIRGTAGLPRERTHLAPEQMLAFRARYPHLKAFILGYMVHLLADLVDVQALVSQRPLMPLILRQHSPKYAQYLIETYYMTSWRVHKPVAIRHNAVLAELGLASATVALEAELMAPYLEKADYRIALDYLKKNGPQPNPAMREIEQIHTSALTRALFYCAGLEKLNREVLRRVRASESFQQMAANQ